MSRRERKKINFQGWMSNESGVSRIATLFESKVSHNSMPMQMGVACNQLN